MIFVRPSSLPHPPPHSAVVASARVRSPALQAGPVLILHWQLHPPSRSRGRKAAGLLLHVLEVLISYHHPRRWLRASQ